MVVASATAQAQAATVRGTVTGADATPLANAIVSIPVLDLKQFTNAQGKFYFVQVPAGTYRVTVRQLGFSPATIDVTLNAGRDADVVVTMQRIVSRLAAMKVSAQWKCEAPGPPAVTGNRQLADVFEQLEQNALRLRLLSEEYPFAMTAERRRVLQRADGRETLEGIDSVETQSAATSHYMPGAVVKRIPSVSRSPEYLMEVPTLLDFADGVFQDNHCFILRGLDNSSGRPQIRVDFQASTRLKTPDVAGSVFLEPETFRLLRSEIWLTRMPSNIAGLAGVRATTQFADMVPGMPTVREVVATTDLKGRGGRNRTQRAVETQTTLFVRFLGKRPDAVPPP